MKSRDKGHANVAVFVPHAGCTHRCAFCNQSGVSGYVRAPSLEEAEGVIRKGLESLGEKARYSQIAFFGGSFTAVDEAYRLGLLRTARKYVGGDGFSGIRISTRPDRIDTRILAQLKEHGVEYVELGVQSMDAGVLEANRRGHTPKDVTAASEMIRRYGFALGCHMMTGLFTSTPEKDMATARELAALGPDSVRIHPTLVITGTELERLYKSGLYEPDTLDAAVGLCGRLLNFFTQRGIKVIRVGLHSGGITGGSVAAGPYHPAFRELCEGRLMLCKALGQLEQKGIAPGRIYLKVANGAVSKMAGQGRRNIAALGERGYEAKIIEDEGIGYLQVEAYS